LSEASPFEKQFPSIWVLVFRAAHVIRRVHCESQRDVRFDISIWAWRRLHRSFDHNLNALYFLSNIFLFGAWIPFTLLFKQFALFYVVRIDLANLRLKLCSEKLTCPFRTFSRVWLLRDQMKFLFVFAKCRLSPSRHIGSNFDLVLRKSQAHGPGPV